MRKHIARYYRYCPYCGNKMSYIFDERIRPICRNCGFRNFLNPTVGVAVVVLENKRLLLGRRNRDPFKGKWCIPCGHVEFGEDIREAAKREFREETGLLVEIYDIVEVLSNWHNPEHPTVGVWFFGKIVDGELKAGSDLSELGFFSYENIRELDMAFPTDIMVINKIKHQLT